jgi:hypothetical protein
MLRAVASKPLNDADRQQIEAGQVRFRLARLLRRTEEILKLAQEQSWETVEQLERERQAELVACFNAADLDDSPEIVEALAALLHMNRQITQQVEDAREKLVAEQRARESHKSLAREYENEYHRS